MRWVNGWIYEGVKRPTLPLPEYKWKGVSAENFFGHLASRLESLTNPSQWVSCSENLMIRSVSFVSEEGIPSTQLTVRMKQFFSMEPYMKMSFIPLCKGKVFAKNQKRVKVRWTHLLLLLSCLRTEDSCRCDWLAKQSWVESIMPKDLLCINV